MIYSIFLCGFGSAGHLSLQLQPPLGIHWMICCHPQFIILIYFLFFLNEIFQVTVIIVIVIGYIPQPLIDDGMFAPLPAFAYFVRLVSNTYDLGMTLTLRSSQAPILHVLTHHKWSVTFTLTQCVQMPMSQPVGVSLRCFRVGMINESLCISKPLRFSASCRVSMFTSRRQ